MDTSTPLPRDDYRHIYEFHTRFGDLDPQGHVNNCTFLGYLEDARLEMFHSEAVRKGEPPVKGMVVSRHEIDYKLPLEFSVHPYRVESWITEARAASFKLAHAVRDDDHIYATAKSTMVAFDVAAARPRRFTPQERTFLTRYLTP